MADVGPVAIVGGGVIGLSLAYYLADSGVEVDVIERRSVGSGASWGNAGWICLTHSAPVPAPGVVRYALRSLGRPDSPLYLRPRLDPGFAAWLLRFSQSTGTARFTRGYEAVAELNRSTFGLFDGLAAAGVQTGLRRVGMVHAFLAPSGARSLRAQQARMAPGRYDVGGEIVEGDGASELDPALSRSVRAAYLTPGEAAVDPRRLTDGLAKAVAERGGRIHESTRVTGFRREGGAIAAALTGGGEIPCRTVAITAGADSADLLRHFGRRLPLQAGKGYSFSVRLDPAPTHALYLGDRKIAVTPLDGTTRIAGTMELSGNNHAMDWRRVIALARGSTQYLGPWFTHPDELADRIQDPWVGARPLLPDGLPVIDRLPGHDDVYLATGHGMLGMALAPATGRHLADYILDGHRPGVLEPFRYGRR